jgi:manganese/iron transport system ATP-binding protein
MVEMLLRSTPQQLSPSPSVTAAPALMVDHLTAGYAGSRNAVQDVSFQVFGGERVAVIGPNGAGKSTLFKSIAGLIPFTGGSISIHGQSCETSHNIVGYVPQNNEIDWNFPVTVSDVVMMARARQIGWLRLPSRGDRDIVTNSLKEVGLEAFAQRQIGELSGGQRRRVFIARALAQEADVLLLDEPFNGVDTSAEEEIMDTLETLSAQGVTLLVATHDMDMARSRFDKMLVLKQRVIGYGTPEAVFRPEILKQAYGGSVSVVQQGEETFIIADEHGCG